MNTTPVSSLTAVSVSLEPYWKLTTTIIITSDSLRSIFDRIISRWTQNTLTRGTLIFKGQLVGMSRSSSEIYDKWSVSSLHLAILSCESDSNVRRLNRSSKNFISPKHHSMSIFAGSIVSRSSELIPLSFYEAFSSISFVCGKYSAISSRTSQSISLWILSLSIVWTRSRLLCLVEF